MPQLIVGILMSHYIRIIQDPFQPTRFHGIRQAFVGFAAWMIVVTVSLRTSDEFDLRVEGSDCNTHGKYSTQHGFPPGWRLGEVEVIWLHGHQAEFFLEGMVL